MRALPIALVSAALLAAASVRADDPDPKPFGERGRTAFVVDQLFGVASTKNLMLGAIPFPEDKTRTHAGVLGASMVPRFGLHRFVRPWLSLGISGQYASTQLESFTFTTYGLFPRIGVLYAFSSRTAIWVRAGFGYMKADEQKSEDASWNLTVGGEAFLVFTPAEHFGLTFGPSFDGGIAGKVATQSNAAGDVVHHNVTVRTIAVTLGFVADF